MKKFLLLLVVCIESLTPQLFAQECVQKDILKQIYSLGDAAVLFMNAEKVYLNPDRVGIDEGRICLYSDHYGTLILSELKQDSTGLYTMGLYTRWFCNGKDCGSVYYSHPGTCDDCGSTDFTYVEYLEY